MTQPLRLFARSRSHAGTFVLSTESGEHAGAFRQLYVGGGRLSEFVRVVVTRRLGIPRNTPLDVSIL